MAHDPTLLEGLAIRFAKHGTGPGFAFVSYLRAGWTLPSAPFGQDVPDHKGDNDDCHHDSDNGDGGRG
jgi:hypothetical protein